MAPIVTTYVTLEEVFRPGFIGNGRLRVGGIVNTDVTVTGMEWSVVGPDEVQTWFPLSLAEDLEEGDVFSFWVGPFVQWQEYDIYIRVTPLVGSPETTLLVHLTWFLTVRDVESRFLNIYMPSFMQSSELGRGIFLVHARAMADQYTVIEDACLQAVPQYTTWAIGEWEDQVGLARAEGTSLENRRLAVLARRRTAPASRTAFFANVTSLLGNFTVFDDYDDYRVDIRISGPPDLALRRQAENVILETKPAGIQIVISYSAFLAGISEAGDPL